MLRDRLLISNRVQKRYLSINDYSFLEGPKMPFAQVLSAWEVPSGCALYDGLNHSFSNGDELADLTSALMGNELDCGNVSLTPPNTERGRGLVAKKSYRDGDIVATASCLWFDNKDFLMKHLRQHPWYKDRTIQITGVKHPTKGPTTVWACLVGVAQYVQHYSGVRARPNATFNFDVSKGFNEGALTLRCSSFNAAGIAPNKEIAVNYCAGFTFAVDDDVELDTKKFKFTLDTFFSKLNDVEHVPDATPAKRKSDEALDGSEPEPKRAATPGTASFGATPRWKPISEASLAGASESHDHGAAQVGSAAAALPHRPLAVFPEPPSRLHLLDGILTMESDFAANKKLPKNFLLMKWEGGDVKPHDDVPLDQHRNCVPYVVNFNSVVWSDKHAAGIVLKKLITDTYPLTTNVYGYSPWAEGRLPQT